MRSGWTHGSTLDKDRNVRYFSSSSLELADTGNGGCLRKWFYKTVLKVEQPTSPNMASGTALHAELERYLLTGDKHLSGLAMRGLHFVPDPGSGILVEHDIGGPADPQLVLDGVPMVGFIDLVNTRGTNKGGTEVGDTVDPPGTVELLDWKWKGDGSRSEYFLSEDDLHKSIQMTTYGMWAHKHLQAKHVRLSHGYFPARKGNPRKVTKLHVIDDLGPTWEYMGGLARVVKDIAKESSVDKVPGNRFACQKYGGCHLRDSCTAFKNDSLETIFGTILGAEMGLLSSLDLKAQLAKEEAEQRIQAAKQAVTLLPGFKEAWQTIESSGRGTPALGLDAAAMYAAMTGSALTKGAGIAGTGELGALMLQNAVDVVTLANELREAMPAQPAQTHVEHRTPPIMILPPDAPESKPELAAKPVEGFTLPGTLAGIGNVVEVATSIALTDEGTAKKRGRPKKVEIEKVEVTEKPEATEETTSETKLQIFVDCIPNQRYEALHPYIDSMCNLLANKFGVPDIRLQEQGILSHGKWKAALNAMVRNEPPPAGTYYLSTKGDEISQEVAIALRTVCSAGGLYVRGV